LKQIRRHFTYANVMSSIAVFLMLGGATAFAATKIGANEIKANSIKTGKIVKEAVTAGKIKKNAVTESRIADGAVTTNKIATDAVTGDKVKESTLGEVPLAANANNIGGTPLTGLLQTAGCQSGKVLGFARLRGQSGVVPATYTSDPAAVDTVLNCSGQSVEVRRTGTGRYFIRFNGNPAAFAFAQVRFDDEGIDENNCATVRKATAGPDANAFAVTVFNCSDNAVEDTDVTFMLP